MNAEVITDAELAERLKLDGGVDELHRLMKRHRWPRVKIGRFNYRFTDAMVEQIIAQHTETPAAPVEVLDNGLTTRSARRAS